MGSPKPQLSLWEKTTLILAILRALSNGISSTLLAPFRGTSGSSNVATHVKIAIVRSLMKHTTVRQLQAISPPTEEAYNTFAKKENFPPNTIASSDGTKAFWIGNPNAEKVVVWYHGGGYALPPEHGHFAFFQSIVSSSGGKAAVLVPEYTLSPHGVYPRQLQEGVAILRHLCTDLARSPQDIVIAGDSAGANLAIGILSHILHPHSEIPALKLQKPLNAAILLAPWASFRTDWPSTTTNANKDLVSGLLGDYWSASFLGGKARDPYNEPCSAPNGWFEGLEAVVGDVLVAGGADEVLADCIRAFASMLERVHGKVRTVIARGEWHDQPVNATLGAGGEQAEAIEAFVRSRV